MTGDSIEAFTTLFMKPIRLAAIFYLMIFTLMIVALIKTLKNGVTELQNNRDGTFQDTDLILTAMRVVFVLLLVSIFFGF